MRRLLVLILAAVVFTASTAGAITISEMRARIQQMQEQEAQAHEDYLKVVQQQRQQQKAGSRLETNTQTYSNVIMQPPKITGKYAKLKIGIWKDVARKFGSAIQNARKALLSFGICPKIPGVASAEKPYTAKQLADLYYLRFLQRIREGVQKCAAMSPFFFTGPHLPSEYLPGGQIAVQQMQNYSEQFGNLAALRHAAQRFQAQYGDINTVFAELTSLGVHITFTTSYQTMLYKGGRNLFLLGKKDGVKAVAKLWRSVDPHIHFLPGGVGCISLAGNFISLAMQNIQNHRRIRESVCVLHCLSSTVKVCEKCIGGVK